MMEWTTWNRGGKMHGLNEDCDCEFCTSELGAKFRDCEVWNTDEMELLISPNDMSFFLFWPKEGLSVHIDVDMAFTLAATFSDILHQYATMLEEAESQIEGGVN